MAIISSKDILTVVCVAMATLSCVTGKSILDNTLSNYTSEQISVLNDQTVVLIRDYSGALEGTVDESTLTQDELDMNALINGLEGLTGGEIFDLEEEVSNNVSSALGNEPLAKLEKEFPKSAKFLHGGEFNKYDSVCMAYGDPHVLTYDNRMFTLSQEGEYVMTATNTSWSNDRCGFAVNVNSQMIKNKTSWHYPSVRYVNVDFKDLEINKTRNTIKLVDTMTATFENKTLNLTNGHVELSSDVVVDHHTEHGHEFIRVANPNCKINIIFMVDNNDGSSVVYVSMKKDMFNTQLNGICGNNNGDKSDDKFKFTPI